MVNIAAVGCHPRHISPNHASAKSVKYVLGVVLPESATGVPHRRGREDEEAENNDGEGKRDQRPVNRAQRVPEDRAVRFGDDQDCADYGANGDDTEKHDRDRPHPTAQELAKLGPEFSMRIRNELLSPTRTHVLSIADRFTKPPEPAPPRPGQLLWRAPAAVLRG